MIKHSCICDKCGKEEDMIRVGEAYNLPIRWRQFGVCPKYDLCGECASTLECSINTYIYNFVNSSENIDKDFE